MALLESSPDRDSTRGNPDAERASEYLIAHVKAASGHRFHQGRRIPPLVAQTEDLSPALRFVASERLHRIPTGVARALLAWGDGFPVELLTAIPSPRHVLALQARGQRCVSLLPDGAETGVHQGPLSFAVHDLCHLDKFIDPEHHLGQLGFFDSLHRATETEAWARFEARFDEAFRYDWHHVGADMNGSAVFLFAALKMKLKMAVRRGLGGPKGAPPLEHGPLTTEEQAAFDAALGDLVSLLGLSPSVEISARAISTRRDDRGAAIVLLRYFEDVGRQLDLPEAIGPK